MFISSDIDEKLSEKYQEICSTATIKYFPYNDLPSRVRNLNYFYFKAIFQALAFKNHKVLLAFDSSVVFFPEYNITVS